MRVMLLKNSAQVYSSNWYLVFGDWSKIGDTNTLVDLGRDDAALNALEKVPTGVGRWAFEQVFLTHGHYDDVELLRTIRDRFLPTVCASSSEVEEAERILQDDDELKAGDGTFEVLHTPGYSSDSLCLYCGEEEMLFAGDTSLLDPVQRGHL